MATGFFLLGDSLQDAVNVCVRNLGDMFLAITICRLKEGSENGPVLSKLLKDTLIPEAILSRDRFMLSWAFEMTGYKDLAYIATTVCV